ncbi:MFS transporter [Nocardia cyriacigeorgica]|uniref:MFS transporter n=1 Tax=Nocardia cyriacigeorgica TaxID=135487 RepID=UPI0018940117|nr:MFS transporter [Nocardia cyriacigeorgica]MBF6414576.1 MFS transporter [Nocardia cyriacigeorgica]
MNRTDTLRPVDTAQSILAEPRVRRVLGANMISMLGSSMAPVALAFAVLGTGSGIGGLSVVLALNAIPALMFLLLGGVLADRYSRSRLLVIGRCGAGIAQLCIAALVLSGTDSTLSLAAAGFISGAAVTITGPAAQGILRQVVSVQQLPSVNAVNRVAGNTIRIAGPVLGGAAAAVVSPGWVLVFDGTTFFLAAAMVLRIDLPHVGKNRASGAWRSLLDGAAEIRRKTWLLANIIFGSLLVLCWRVGYQLTGPAIMADVDGGSARWGFVQGAFGLGMVLGGFVMLRWRPRRLVVVSIAACGSLAAPLIALAAQCPTVFVVACSLVAGIGMDIAIICWSTALGQHISDDMQGRVFAFTSLGELSAVPFGYLAIGLAGRDASLFALELVCGVGIIAAVAMNLCVRSVWSIHRVT